MEVKISKWNHTDEVPMGLLIEADPSEDMIRKYLHTGDLYLVKSGHDVVGAFVLMPNSAHEIELKNIVVEKKYRRQGIGREIIKHAIRVAKMEGFDDLVVKTSDASSGPQEFYRKMKFEPYFTVKGHFIKYYKQPIIEDGEQAVDQIVFKRKI